MLGSLSRNTVCLALNKEIQRGTNANVYYVWKIKDGDRSRRLVCDGAVKTASRDHMSM